MPAADTLNWSGWSSYQGPPAWPSPASLEEIIRPGAVTGRGLAFTSGIGAADRVRLSYRELTDQAAVAADRLRRHGAGPGALVAMTLANDLPSVLALLGTWACGATVVSLPPFPRRAASWYASQFGRVLDSIGAAFLIEGAYPVAEIASRPGLRRISAQALAEPSADRVADHVAARPPRR